MCVWIHQETLKTFLMVIYYARDCFYFLKSEVGETSEWRALPCMCACVGLVCESVVVFNQVRVRHERPLTRPCSAFLHLLQPKQRSGVMRQSRSASAKRPRRCLSSISSRSN